MPGISLDYSNYTHLLASLYNPCIKCDLNLKIFGSSKTKQPATSGELCPSDPLPYLYPPGD